MALTQKTLGGFERRLQIVGPDSHRRWGSMTVEAMLAHLRHMIEISLGETPVRDRSNLFTSTIAKAIFPIIPFPRGIKAPPEFTIEPENLEIEKEHLHRAMERFTQAAEATPERLEIHPLLGACSLRYWAKVHGKHIDHHFRQFSA